MKPINFISTPSPHQQRSLQRWYRVFLVCSGALLLGIITLQTIQLWQWHAMRTELQQLTSKTQTTRQSQEQYQTLSKQHDNLKKQLAQLDAIIDAQKKIGTTLNALKTTVSSSHIERCIVSSNTVDATLVCTHARQAHDNVAALKESPAFKQVQLSSLQPHQGSTGFAAQIRAKVR